MSEVDRIFKQAEIQEPVVKINMEVGNQILVLSGPFKDFEGEVIEVSPERGKLKACSPFLVGIPRSNWNLIKSKNKTKSWLKKSSQLLN
jgi:hypothetical protein